MEYSKGQDDHFAKAYHLLSDKRKKFRLEQALRNKRQNFKSIDSDYLELFEPKMVEQMQEQSYLGKHVVYNLNEYIKKIQQIDMIDYLKNKQTIYEMQQ